MNREPGALAQLGAALAALLTYAIVKTLNLLPEERDLVAPLVAYVASQLALALWARRLTTPVASPQLPAGTAVVVTDAQGTPTSTQTLVE